MAIDCERLSPKARQIYEKLKPYFGDNGFDPWGNLLCTAEGQIRDNTVHDMRKGADRQKMINRYQHMIGHVVYLAADSYRRKRGSLKGFSRQRYSRLIQNWAELLVLLYDLDFQIETLDLVEGVSDPCPSCDSEFPDFDGWDCKCGYKLPAKARKTQPRIE